MNSSVISDEFNDTDLTYESISVNTEKFSNFNDKKTQERFY